MGIAYFTLENKAHKRKAELHQERAKNLGYSATTYKEIVGKYNVAEQSQNSSQQTSQLSSSVAASASTTTEIPENLLTTKQTNKYKTARKLFKEVAAILKFFPQHKGNDQNSLLSKIEKKINKINQRV